MPTLYAYIRVSTVEQAKNYSPDTQRDLYDKALSANPSYSRAAPVEDLGHSAYKVMIFKRPLFRELMKKVQSGDAIFFAYVDRACRNCGDIVRLHEWATRKGVTLMFGNMPFISDPIIGKIVLVILALVAELESYFKSVRIREAVASRKKHGLAVSKHRPLYKQAGRPKHRRSDVDLEEQTDFAHAIPLIEQGVSLQEIAVFLQRRLAERTGRKFNEFEMTQKPHWNKARVRHAYALWMALHAAGADPEKIREVELMGREKLQALYPWPNNRL